MFEGEVQTAGIQMDFVLTNSFNELKVDWVKIDPSRVLQVLINLTTNAIKFTTTEETRTIKVILSASSERPSDAESPTVDYFPMRQKRIDQTSGPDWGDGEEIFLEFAVRDTGRGLTPEEKKLLFQRFKQASPRTHVTYGGSGLGLFISRELTELQGGEIGVSSEAGVGSTFAFYVKCRRSSEPQDPVESTGIGLSLARKPSNAKTKPPDTHVAPKVKDFATLPNNIKQIPMTRSERADLKVLIVEDNLGMSLFPLSHHKKNISLIYLISQPKSPPTPTQQRRHRHHRRQPRRRSPRMPQTLDVLEKHAPQRLGNLRPPHGQGNARHGRPAMHLCHPPARASGQTPWSCAHYRCHGECAQ